MFLYNRRLAYGMVVLIKTILKNSICNNMNFGTIMQNKTRNMY